MPRRRRAPVHTGSLPFPKELRGILPEPIPGSSKIVCVTQPSAYGPYNITRWIGPVDPALATKLQVFNTQNRRPSSPVVTNYAWLMWKKYWKDQGSAIVLSNIRQHGVLGSIILLDGNQRLLAICRSKTTQQCEIMYGAPREMQDYIDGIHVRSLADALKLSGRLTSHTSLFSGTIRRFRRGPSLSYGKVSIVEHLAFFDQHRAAITFGVESLLPKKEKVTVAPVAAALARAWYYIDDKALLRRVGEVMIQNKSENDAEQAILNKLRDWLKANSLGGAPMAAAAFLRTEWAIRMLVQNRGADRFVPLEQDIYPLPHVDPATGKVNGSTRHTVRWFRENYVGDDEFEGVIPLSATSPNSPTSPSSPTGATSPTSPSSPTGATSPTSPTVQTELAL